MSDEPIRVSYSWLHEIEWCPRLFSYKRVEHFPSDRPKNISAVIGSAAHNTIEAMYKSSSFSLEFLLSEWPRYFAQNIERERFEFKTTSAETRWFNMGESILGKFFETAGKEGLLVPPVATEWRFSTVVTGPSGRQYKIKGVADLLIHPFELEPLDIIDYKSGSHKMTQVEANENPQGKIYSLGYRSVFKNTERRVGFFYLRYGEILWSTKVEQDHTDVIAEIDRAYERVLAKDFAPTYKNCFLCDFQGRCKAEDAAKETGLPKGWFFPKA